MKVKFTKNLGSNKADSEVEIADASEAKSLVDGGFAVEVKETAESVIEKATTAIAERLDGQDKSITEIKNTVAKTLAQISKAKRSDITVVGDRVDGDPQGGFKNVGDYLHCVIKAGKREGVDPRLERLNKAASTYQDETTPADGGNAVPTQYADFLYNDIMEDADGLVGRSFKLPISLGNSMDVPCDNTTQLGQNGILAQVIQEGASIAATKAATRQITFKVRKLAALVNVTDELMQDTNVALPAYLNYKTKYAFDYKINDDFLFGKASTTGSATDVADGVVGHAATVSVSVPGAEYNAGGIELSDLLNMKAQFYGDRSQAVWIMGPDTEAEIGAITSPNGFPLYVAPGGMNSDSSISKLLGFPVIVSYHAAPFNTAGDIILGDWTKMFCAIKGGMESASTPYLYFDQMLMTFRTVFRLYARPERSATLLNKAGTQSLGNFVTLQSRL